MTYRLSTILLFTCLFSACDKGSGGEGGTGGTTSTNTDSGGSTSTGGTVLTGSSGGAGGAGASTGGLGGSTTSSSGGTGGTTTSSTTSALCMDGGQGSVMGGIYPSDCPCRPEAEAYLPVIAQAALQHFQSSNALCGEAAFVPAIIPAGVGYNPAKLDGMDFLSGDADNGWVCLGWQPVGGIHCRFGYSVGSGYMGPLVGGPDPGSTGFEVWAQGDTTGDGVYGTFSITGTLDPQTGTYTLGSMFEHQPDE